jgi:sortase A
MPKPTKARKRSIVYIALGCCCLIAAAALGYYNKLDSDRAGETSGKLTADVTALLAEAAPPPEAIPTDGPIDPELSQLGTVANTGDTSNTANVGGYDISGIISIPDIDISLAVISEWSYPNLAVSACRYTGDTDGQMIIIAHNYESHFGKIDRLDPGDRVTFTDAAGVVHSYEVTNTELWATGQLREIITGDSWDLTLFTCTYSGNDRVVVRLNKRDA